MKTLLLASLLLFAVPVGDEITESDIVDDRVYLEGRPCYASTDARGKLFAHCFMPGLKGDVVIDVLPDPCLTKMESAMRAMEFWLVLNIEDTAQVNLSIVQPDQYGNYWAVLPEEQRLEEYTPLGLTRLLNVKAAEAIVRWDTARRECWKEKP